MREIFEYEGIEKEEVQEAMDILGEDKFMAITLLASAEMIQERAQEIEDEAEKARERAKKLLKQGVDES